MTVCPPDDNPHVFLPDRRTRPVFRLDDLADAPSYVEPHALLGPALLEPPFPPWHWDTLRRVREMAPDASVHGEVFSPFSQLCEAVGLEDALVALRTDAARVEAALAARCEATVELMAGLVAAGADAVLVSSAYAGAGSHLRRATTGRSSSRSRRGSSPGSRRAAPARRSTRTPAVRSATGSS